MLKFHILHEAMNLLQQIIHARRTGMFKASLVFVYSNSIGREGHLSNVGIGPFGN